jgi:AhpD family alkylhydroperoxidase
MSRIRKLEPEDWPEELQQLARPSQATALEQGLMRFFAHRPELAKGLMMFAGALKTERLLPDRLIELVRLRVAFFNQCRSCMAIRYTDAVDAGMTEETVCSLERPAEAQDLSDAEKAAIRYGELLAADHLAIDDEVYEELHRHFSEEQVVELGMHVGFFVGFGRLAATWHMVEELPERFAAEGEVTPWGEDAVQVR